MKTLLLLAFMAAFSGEIIVTGTKYQPVAAQCDSNPLGTADGSVIDTVLLKQGKIRWCALSRDLLSRWGGPFSYGDTIVVSRGTDAANGKWVIHDTMNKRYTLRIDFLQFYDRPIYGRHYNLLIKKL
jgi:hypothetical protein